MIEIHLPISGGRSYVLVLALCCDDSHQCSKGRDNFTNVFFYSTSHFFSIFLLDSVIQHPAFHIRKKMHQQIHTEKVIYGHDTLKKYSKNIGN